MKSRIKNALLFAVMLIPWIGFAETSSIEERSSSESMSSPPMYCHTGLQISVNEYGFAVIRPEMMLVEVFPDYDDFIVEIINPALSTDTITCDLVGQNISVMVTDTVSGNSCWSTITVEDKLDPVIVCDTFILACSFDPFDLPDSIKPTLLSDNCTAEADLLLTYSQSLTNLDCSVGPYVLKVTRNWTVTDESGNNSTCSQIILFKKGSLSEVDFPSDTTFDCPTANTDVSITGVPTIGGLPFANLCMLVYAKNDQVLRKCGNSSLIRRTFTVTDWCTGLSRIDTQYIHIIDTLPPQIYCPVDMTIQATANCTADFVIPTINASDLCANDSTINFYYKVDGIATGPMISGLGLGNHVITVFAYDPCFNSDSCNFNVRVIDTEPPTLVCHDIIVSLGNNGLVTLPYHVPQFSYSDNCEVVDTLIRRMSTTCGFPADIVYGTDVTFCCDDVGRQNLVLIQVTDINGNTNECMFNVMVKDNNGPVLRCPDDLTIDCTQIDDDIDFGTAVITSGCPFALDSTIIENIDICGEGSIIRTFMATSSSGNVITCQQTITVINPFVFNVDSIMFPSDAVLNTCTPDTTVANLGSPVVASTACSNIIVSHRDSIPSNNGFCYTLFRIWEVVNTCDANTRFQDIQIINIEDLIDPVISCPADITLNCPADTTILTTGEATATDNCAGTVNVSYSDVVTQGSCPNTFSVVRTWIATDPCGNRDLCQQNIEVIDNTPPSIVCPIDISVACNADTMPSSTGIAMASDACFPSSLTLTYNDVVVPGNGNIIFTVTRTWTVTDACNNSNSCDQIIVVIDSADPSISCPDDITAYLTSTCEVFVNIPPPSVVDACGDVTVTNDGNGDDLLDASGIYPLGTTTITYTAVDESGNMASCQTDVTVLDSLSPSITCPADVTANCDDPLSPLSIFGSPSFSDNCPGVSIISINSTENLDACGVGTLTRTFTVEDMAGNTANCTQTITVTGISQLDSLDFIWPADTVSSFDCVAIGDVPLILPFLNPNINTCNVIDVDSTITQILPATFGCLTYEIVYTVTDNCNFNQGTGAGQWMFTQLVGIFDTVAPVINPVVLAGPFFADTLCLAPVIIPVATALDNCNSVTITNNSPFATSGGADASGTYPGGNTIVTYTATDACGNIDTLSINVFVMDTISPVMVCIKTELPITDSLTVSITANSSISSVTDNCTNIDDITVTFDLNDFTDTIRTFDCSDVGLLIQVMLYSIDEQGNIDSCESEFGIQDQFNFCPSPQPIAISGNVSTLQGDPIVDVEISMSPDELGSTQMSDVAGEFMFEEISAMETHRLDADKDEIHLQGLSAYDLALMYRHVAQVEMITDPYLLLAADVNGDGGVDIRDVLELRKLLLGIQDDLPVSSWQFFDAHFDLTDVTDPFNMNVPSYVMVYPQNQNMIDANFIGVKTGDLDLSVQTRFGEENTIKKQTSGLVFGRSVNKGQGNQVIPIYFDGRHDLRGGQTQIQLDDQYQILSFEPNDKAKLEVNEIHQDLLQQNLIRIVWIAEDFPDHTQPLGWVTISGESNSKPNWSLSPEFKTEMFDDSGIKYGLDLRSEAKDLGEGRREGFVLYQNTPNPFQNSTLIRFRLPNPARYQLDIYDAHGIQVKQMVGKGGQGLNTIELTNSDLNQKVGLLFYRLSTQDYQATRKMVVKN